MKKKILIIITSLALGGGAEKVASILTKKLSYKYDFHILTFYESNRLYPYKGNYSSLKEDQSSVKRFFILFKLHRYINKISPDLIISFMDHTNMATILTKVIFRLKIPLIISVRVNPKKAYQETRKYYNILIRMFYRLNSVNRIITNVNEIQCLLEENYGISRKKILTIQNGVDIAKIKGLSEVDFSDYEDMIKNPDLIKFVNIGRLSSSKNHKLLINAFSKVYQKMNNTRLIIIGDGTLRSDLKKHIIMKGLDKVIILLGLKENPFCYLRYSDIFILSSTYEGMPNVILEAMACDLPIISTNIPGAREILNKGKYGLLVNSEDEDDLVNKMIEVAGDPNLRKNLKQKSIRRIADFDYKKIIVKWDSEISLLVEQ